MPGEYKFQARSFEELCGNADINNGDHIRVIAEQVSGLDLRGLEDKLYQADQLKPGLAQAVLTSAILGDYFRGLVKLLDPSTKKMLLDVTGDGSVGESGSDRGSKQSLPDYFK